MTDTQPDHHENIDDDIIEKDSLPSTDDEQEIKHKKTLRQKSIYLVPNMFTLGALFSSFYGILMALNASIMNTHDYRPAAIATFVAMILDGMDGRAARKLNAQSAFGAQLDSLADMVSFGVAPAIIAYTWQLHNFELGWAIAFIYCACAALRLALFNVLIGVVDKRWFIGVPSPAAAAIVVGLVYISYDPFVVHYISSEVIQYVALFLVFYSGISMIVPFKFWSFKDLHVRKKVPFYYLLVPIIFFIVLMMKPALTLFTFFVLYSLSGYIMVLRNVYIKKEPWPTYPSN